MGLISKCCKYTTTWFVAIAIVYNALLYIYTPHLRQELHLEKATGKAKIVVEHEFGIPYLETDSPEMMFYTQGYVHAQDRLWAMERLRRFANATLSEMLGDTTLPIDKLSISFGIHKAA